MQLDGDGSTQLDGDDGVLPVECRGLQDGFSLKGDRTSKGAKNEEMLAITRILVSLMLIANSAIVADAAESQEAVFEWKPPGHSR